MSLPRYGRGRQEVPVVDHRRTPVPWSVPVEGGEIVEEVDQAAPEVSDAERARTIVENGRSGVLGVMMNEGIPGGFFVPYVVLDDASICLGLSEDVEKILDIGNSERASLTVAETPLTASHASAHGGVSMFGTLTRINPSDENYETKFTRYARSQPADAAFVKQGSAKLFLLTLGAVLVSMSNGLAMCRVDLADFASATSDPLATISPSLLTHLNGNDGGSLVLLCRAYGGQPGTVAARLSSIDQYGMDLLVRTANGRESVRLNFSQPVSTPEEVRRELSVMARGARFKLGVG